MFDIGSKAGFEKVFRSLSRSRVRTEILMYLYKNYPKAPYLAEIARNTGIDLKNVLGGLRGMSWFDASNSLLKHGVVEKTGKGYSTCYRLSERGKALVESLHETFESTISDKKKAGGE